MTKLLMPVPGQSGVARDHDALSRDPRYAHFIRIPDRICRCLDYFEVGCDRIAVKERLHSYYLFIGVVDEVLDSTRLEAGREILNQLAGRDLSLDSAANQSHPWVVTEVLRGHIEEEVYSQVQLNLEELYQAVIRERSARTLARHIEERRIVGRLTADLSYLLIHPLLARGREDLRAFLRDVGEVGCLVDSCIDLRADYRLGLLGFAPTRKNHLQLICITLRSGMKISFRHPRLVGLFLEAIGDICLDQLRSITATSAVTASEQAETHIAVAVAAPETLSSVAWTKP